MTDLLDHITANWGVLSSAPFVFATIVLLAFGSSYLVARWRYEAVLALLRERIEALRDRLAAKDEQLGDYRERLHLVPATGTVFSRLTNAELKGRVLKTVEEMRAFLAQFQARQHEQLFGDGWRMKAVEMTEEERRDAWARQTQAFARESFRINAEWDTKFKVDSIILRDELLARVPAEAKNEREYRTYEHPTNAIGMQVVADDLERLAKVLPDRTT